MARINLLPWRAERRKQRQKEFGIMLAFAALAGVVLWFLVNSYYNSQIDGQNERNAYLQEQIKQVEAKITEIDELDRQKARLLARKEVIEQLQANRSQMVHLFDSLVRTIPDGVTLASIKQEGEILTLEGNAQSNARVSAYMRNLEVSGWMTKPDLSIIEVKKDEKTPAAGSAGRTLPYGFSLKVQLANPNAQIAEGMPGALDPAVAVDAPAESPATAATDAPALASDGSSSATSPAPTAAPAQAAPAAPQPAAPQPAAGDEPSGSSEQPAQAEPASQGRPAS